MLKNLKYILAIGLMALGYADSVDASEKADPQAFVEKYCTGKANEAKMKTNKHLKAACDEAMAANAAPASDDDEELDGGGPEDVQRGGVTKAQYDAHMRKKR
ncbi:hypothetical protein [Candidatus Finniella inopinata]|uniref:PsiF repeat-containing protein n=1 Tax=Candidatus Finniella inopinata TaxID=1696036 RepID=A0A4Q7DGA9_9PROT|nr:hypothetical protein [Candidatus Finniella inopinata]RZI45833.1 hypothetical protein EQU50_05205 [Candidatus Finniella inopinata]